MSLHRRAVVANQKFIYKKKAIIWQGSSNISSIATTKTHMSDNTMKMVTQSGAGLTTDWAAVMERLPKAARHWQPAV